MNDSDKTIEKLEQSDAWDDADEVVKIEFKKPLDKVIPVRLSAEKWEELRQEAKELGIGPSTLARMWILKSLQKEVKERDKSLGISTDREANSYGTIRENKLAATYNQGKSVVNRRKIFSAGHADVPISRSGKIRSGSRKVEPDPEKRDRKRLKQRSSNI